MSVIYIVDHNESIYDVIKTRTKIIKPPRIFESYLDTEHLKEIQKTKKQCATMGPPEYKRPNPKNFLKKHGKSVLHNIKWKPKAYVPQVPTVKEAHELAKKAKATGKKVNFIKENVENVKSLKPPEIEPKFIDTRIGTVKKVENSGLEPKYTRRYGFGKPPIYLVQRVHNSKKFLQIMKDKKALESLTKCRYVTRPEREALLNGLKKNWEELQKEFQLLPIITDTIPKILRKSKLEDDLKELEKDIVLIEKHPFIYVFDEE